MIIIYTIITRRPSLDYRYVLPGLVLLGSTSAPIVVAADYLNIDAAQKIAYPLANSFQEIHLTLTAEEQRAMLVQAGPQPGHGMIRIWKAMQAGSSIGYFFVDEVIGRQSLITYAVGIDAEGALHHLEIMTYRESHGSEVRNAAWRSQFNDRSNLGQLRFGADIKNISGATLSSEHVTQGVRWLFALWQAALRPNAPTG